jgi:hypothetical protein
MKGKLKDLPGKTLSLYVMDSDLYFDVYFADWGSGGGSVEYFRSWSHAPMFVPHPPDPFEMHLLTVPVVITPENIASEVLPLTWDATTDPDLDLVKYRVTASLDAQSTMVTFVDSIVEEHPLTSPISY